jgi:hypothetical protein
VIAGPLVLTLVVAPAPAPPDPSAPASAEPPVYAPPADPATSTAPSTTPTTAAPAPDPTAPEAWALDPAAPPVHSSPPPLKLLGPPSPEPPPVFTPVPLEQRPPPPQGSGLGLIIGAAIAGGVNVGLAAARIGLSLGEYDERRDTIRHYLTVVATPISVVAGVGLAAGGGYLRGRRDGWRSAYDGEPNLRDKAYRQTGAVMLAIGAVGYVMAWIPWQGDSSLDSRGGGTVVVESVSSLVLIGGAGLLLYGHAWGRHAELHGYSRRFGLRPALGPGRAGLTLVGRF